MFKKEGARLKMLTDPLNANFRLLSYAVKLRGSNMFMLTATYAVKCLLTVC